MYDKAWPRQPTEAEAARQLRSITADQLPGTRADGWLLASSLSRWDGDGMTQPRAIVEQGYDAMADQYLAYMSAVTEDPRLRFLEMLETRLAPGSDVVDLGCGAGLPGTAQLAIRHNVLGIDISEQQIIRARQNVPSARFEKSDLTTAPIASGSVDAVTAFYSLTHVPQEEHEALFRRIAGWLRPGGYFLSSLSAHGLSNGVQADFVGVPMYFSGYDAATNRLLLQAAGFVLDVDEVVTMDEPSGPSTFHWVLARLTDRTTAGPITTS